MKAQPTGKAPAIPEAILGMGFVVVAVGLVLCFWIEALDWLGSSPSARARSPWLGAVTHGFLCTTTLAAGTAAGLFSKQSGARFLSSRWRAASAAAAAVCLVTLLLLFARPLLSTWPYLLADGAVLGVVAFHLKRRTS